MIQLFKTTHRILLYPFVSLGAIEAGNLIHTLNEITALVIFIVQSLIGVLTIIKIYKDIKTHKYKSISDEAKKVKKKYPFISALIEFMKRKKE
jgi:hypothetical protein